MIMMMLMNFGSSHRRCFIKKVFLKLSKRLAALLKTPAQVLSCKYYEIYKNIYFEERLRKAASRICMVDLFDEYKLIMMNSFGEIVDLRAV